MKKKKSKINYRPRNWVFDVRKITLYVLQRHFRFYPWPEAHNFYAFDWLFYSSVHVYEILSVYTIKYVYSSVRWEKDTEWIINNIESINFILTFSVLRICRADNFDFENCDRYADHKLQFNDMEIVFEKKKKRKFDFFYSFLSPNYALFFIRIRLYRIL